MSDRIEEFSNILRYPALDRGKLRLAESGLGFKVAPAPGKEAPPVFTVSAGEIKATLWQRASIGFRLRLTLADKSVLLLDGFKRDDHDRLHAALKRFYRLPLETREAALRGWNWGEMELQQEKMLFTVGKRPAFELPLARLASSQLTVKNEISLEFAPDHTDRGFMGDELVEARFYMPGTVEGEGEGEEEVSAVHAFNEEIKGRVDLGRAVGDSLLSFPDAFFLTPRGRYDVDFFASFLRLRGKTYDYKLPYTGIHHLFEAPKPDDLHVFLLVGVEPALRQGQTRYPYLVMQFNRDDFTDVQLHGYEGPADEDAMSEGERAAETEKLARYGLAWGYDKEEALPVFRRVMHAMTGKPVHQAGALFKSVDNADCVRSSHKANEGYLYPMDGHILFLPKPPIVIAHQEIGNVVFMRADTLLASARTFDLKINLRNGNEHVFSNIGKEEHQPLVSYMRNRGIKVVKDLSEAVDVRGTMSYAESSGEEGGLIMEEDEGKTPGGGTFDDEDSEEDTDFVPGKAESDVGEEFDEEYNSSSGEEDAMEE